MPPAKGSTPVDALFSNSLWDLDSEDRQKKGRSTNERHDAHSAFPKTKVDTSKDRLLSA